MTGCTFFIFTLLINLQLEDLIFQGGSYFFCHFYCDEAFLSLYDALVVKSSRELYLILLFCNSPRFNILSNTKKAKNEKFN